MDYDLWNERRASIQTFSQMSQSCIFTVDVFKERYDIASDNFATIFAYNSTWIKTIRKQGDLLEEQYVNVISRHQVIQKDKNGKAWMIMGVMDLSPDQMPTERIKRKVINRKTGEIHASAVVPADPKLTERVKEILLLHRQGLLSKEVAYKLSLSIYTVNSHRKNMLAKLDFDNVIEAINQAESFGILYCLQQPIQTVCQWIVFSPFFQFFVIADSTHENGMIDFYARNQYTVRHIEFNLKNGSLDFRSKPFHNGSSHILHYPILF